MTVEIPGQGSDTELEASRRTVALNRLLSALKNAERAEDHYRDGGWAGGPEEFLAYDAQEASDSARRAQDQYVALLTELADEGGLGTAEELHSAVRAALEAERAAKAEQAK